VATPPAVLMVELIMSIDRMIASAQKSGSRPEEWLQGSEDEWAASVVLGHIAQVDELVWLPRLKQMCIAAATGNPAPSFPYWEPDPEQTVARFQDQTIADVAAFAMSNRTSLLTFVKNLVPEQWSATAKHETLGEVDVRALLMQVLTHDEEHRASLV
jgi:hypothetical protein